jgi:hypothetical protein
MKTMAHFRFRISQIVLTIATVSILKVQISSAIAQYSIDWFTIDGGGGTSTGGVYSVSGTIGQPDAGVMSGGPYSVVGGFWGITAAIQTPGAPLLSIERLNGTVRIFWPLPATGFVLDQTAAMTPPGAAISWSQVPFPYHTNATHISITVPAPAGNKFYRLRKP